MEIMSPLQVQICFKYFLLIPRNDRGDASDLISQSNQICSLPFRAIEHGPYTILIQNGVLLFVDKHERTVAYHKSLIALSLRT